MLLGRKSIASSEAHPLGALSLQIAAGSVEQLELGHDCHDAVTNPAVCWCASNFMYAYKRHIVLTAYMQAWQKYNSPPLDFDLCFATDSLAQMQADLAPGQGCQYQLSWQGKDWRRYLHTYMAGVQHQTFRQSVPANPDMHAFKPWERPSAPQLDASKQTRRT